MMITSSSSSSIRGREGELTPTRTTDEDVAAAAAAISRNTAHSVADDHHHQEEEDVTTFRNTTTTTAAAIDATSNNNNNDDPSSSSSSQYYCILALYEFVPLAADTLKPLQQSLETALRRFEVRGNLLLATEGINGTLSFPKCHHDAVCDILQNQQYGLFGGRNLTTRLSYANKHVFFRLRIRIKKEIVALKQPHLIPMVVATTASSSNGTEDDRNTRRCTEKNSESLTTESPACNARACCRVGTYIPPGPDWDALVNDPDCLLIDTRNEYEIDIGTFRNAINPQTNEFSEFPQWFLEQQQQQQTPPKKIAMFCTGGIRCEKATAYCLKLLQTQQQRRQQKQQQSDDDDVDDDDDERSNRAIQLPDVYHLKGGILAYLESHPDPNHSTFVGECYVFDQRTAVTHGLRPSTKYTSCFACRHPIPVRQCGNDEEKEHDSDDGSGKKNNNELENHDEGRGTCSQEDTVNNKKKNFQQGVYCPHCIDDEEHRQRRQRYQDRQKQMEMAKTKGILHMHDHKEKLAKNVVDGKKEKGSGDNA